MNNNEEKILELKKENEKLTKGMLNLEIVIAIISSVTLITLIFAAASIEMDNIAVVILITIGALIFITGYIPCLIIEQKAGYYECGKCHNKHVPTFKQIMLALHVNRTRYIKCPKCGEKSWNKKVISKE